MQVTIASAGRQPSYRARPALFKRLGVAIVLVSTCIAARSQVPPYEDTELVLIPVGELTTTWKLTEAKIYESFSGTMGYLRLQNISGAVVKESAFYAEYLDPRNNPCFSLAFSQDQNLERRRGGFQAGEVRTLYASMYYSGPAVRPSSVRVAPAETEGTRVVFPARIAFTIPDLLPAAAGRGGSLRLDRSDLEREHGPFVDLGLGLVSVRADGGVRELRILQSRNSSAQAWFETFARVRKFLPSSAEGPGESEAFLLLRAAVSLRCLKQKGYPARESSLLATAAQNGRGPAIPAVIIVLYEPDEERFWERPLQGGFHELSIGSGPSVPEIPASSDLPQSKRAARGPELRKIVPPPQAYACP